MFRSFISRSYSIQKRIQQDLLTALKSKDSSRTALLKQLQSELINYTKRAPAKGATGTGVAEETELIGVIRGCAERWGKAIEEYRRLLESNPARAEDLSRAIEKEEDELCVIKAYLPAPYSAAEIEVAIGEAMAELGVAGTEGSKLGAVIAAVMPKLDPSRITRKDLATAVKQTLECKMEI